MPFRVNTISIPGTRAAQDHDDAAGAIAAATNLLSADPTRIVWVDDGEGRVVADLRTIKKGAQITPARRRSPSGRKPAPATGPSTTIALHPSIPRVMCPYCVAPQMRLARIEPASGNDRDERLFFDCNCGGTFVCVFERPEKFSRPVRDGH